MTKRVQDIIAKGRKAVIDDPYGFTVDTDIDDPSEIRQFISETRNRVSDLRSIISRSEGIEQKLEAAEERFSRAEDEYASAEQERDRLQEELDALWSPTQHNDRFEAMDEVEEGEAFIAEASRYA